jgi:hypothetical protein
MVGQSGTVMHWTGGVGQQLEHGLTSVNLYGVWAASSPTRLYAVGEAGTVLMLENGEWRVETLCWQDLYAVHGSAVGVFAVGDQGIVLEYSDGVWRASESDTYAPLRDVWVTDSTAYAVGDRGTFLEILPR